MTKKRINVLFYEENSWLMMMLPFVRRQHLVHTLLRKRRMTLVSFIEVEKCGWMQATLMNILLKHPAVSDSCGQESVDI
jgi:hypothetical protein